MTCGEFQIHSFIFFFISLLIHLFFIEFDFLSWYFLTHIFLYLPFVEVLCNSVSIQCLQELMRISNGNNNKIVLYSEHGQFKGEHLINLQLLHPHKKGLVSSPLLSGIFAILSNTKYELPQT